MNAALIVSAFLALASALLCAHAETNGVITSAAELAEAVREERTGTHFDLTATVTFPCNTISPTFAVEDDTGSAVLREYAQFPECPMKPGDRVRLKGLIVMSKIDESVCASNGVLKIISHGPAPVPKDTSISELMTGGLVNRFVRFKGTIRDAFSDEIDSNCEYLVIQDGMNSIYALFASPTQQISSLIKLIGAEVSLVGMCIPNLTGNRRIERQLIRFNGFDAIDMLRPAPADPFDVPALGTMHPPHASFLSGMGRRRVNGRVIAVWHGDRFLVQTKDRQIVRINLAERKTPRYGDFVEAVGYPETDLYHINFSRALWRQTDSGNDVQEPEPEELSAAQLLTDRRGQPAGHVQHHGRQIRIKGIVRSLPAQDYPNDRLNLECDRQIIPVDASACLSAFDGVEIGCVVEVSGTFLVETENWRPNAPFPHIEGYAVVVRTPDDVKILERPSWWTPKRLMAVIGFLLAALAGIFFWNRSLNRIAERRGRELAEESKAHISSELKVGERTRLAIELHDALSQNLTGVSLEIATAAKLASQLAPPDTQTTSRNTQHATLQHLDIAARSLKSCRDELRNCIWDLRNYALEETDMNGAVRRTLAPYVAGTELVVRFNVARESLTDNTAHALFRIIRELVQNAIRHGHAKNIKVAGCLDGKRLLFSVEDDGGGFDPEGCPGVQQGHFGLQGIRERVKQFNGEMSIASEAGKGAKVTIAMNMPDDGEEQA